MKPNKPVSFFNWSLTRVLTFLLATHLASCATGKESARAPKESVVTSAENTLVLNSLRENYRPYQSLSATFSLKGKVAGGELAYTGNLTSTPEKFYVLLKDLIFLSPFFSLTVTGTEVTQKDFLQDKTEIIPLNDYRWVQVLGKNFPFMFFLPMLQGYPPEEFFLTATEFRSEGENSGSFRYKSAWFAAIATVKNGIVEKIQYRDETTGDITVFSFSGNAGKNDRYFPARIVIQKPDASEFIDIRFTTTKVSMPVP